MIFLIADDDLDDHEFFRETTVQLMGDNCSIIQVLNGQAAIDYLLARNEFSDEATVIPDVVILDLNMPKLNGLDTLMQIKNTSALARIPVYILTTAWDDSTMKKCKVLGANGYFSKPSEMRILKTIVKQIVSEVERGL